MIRKTVGKVSCLAVLLLACSSWAENSQVTVAEHVYIGTVGHIGSDGGFTIQLTNGEGGAVSGRCQTVEFRPSADTDNNKLKSLHVLAVIAHAYNMRVDVYGKSESSCQVNRIKVDQDF